MPLRAAGTPAEVARALRLEGFDARVERGVVVVESTDRAAVRKAVAKLGPGRVRVRLP
jgi:hypothetical protein